MYTQGVAGTSIDQVVEASGTSKSQLYHYFADKDALVAAVITAQTERVFDEQEPHLERLNSFEGLERWRDLVVQRVRARQGANGCQIGALASELADRSEPARILLYSTFQTWESYLSAGLSRMRERGELKPEADPLALAMGIMAAVQGGYLLAQTARSEHPMEVALDMALNQVRAHCRPAPARADVLDLVRLRTSQHRFDARPVVTPTSPVSVASVARRRRLSPGTCASELRRCPVRAAGHAAGGGRR
jgi:AcrR family transcriptional regulator